jgi:hypothetical protein
MKMFAFATLAVTAIICGFAAGTLRPSPEEHLTVALTETVAAPDLSINVW